MSALRSERWSRRRLSRAHRRRCRSIRSLPSKFVDETRQYFSLVKSSQKARTQAKAHARHVAVAPSIIRTTDLSLAGKRSHAQSPITTPNQPANQLGRSSPEGCIPSLRSERERSPQLRLLVQGRSIEVSQGPP